MKALSLGWVGKPTLVLPVLSRAPLHGSALADAPVAPLNVSLPASAPVIPPAAVSAPADSVAQSAAAARTRIVQARGLVDDIKSRSTLVGLVQPLAMAGGLAEHPAQTWSAVSTIASD